MLLYQKIKIILFEAEMLVGIRKQISKCFGQKIYLVVCTERHSFFVLRGKLLFLFMKFKQHQKICTI